MNKKIPLGIYILIFAPLISILLTFIPPMSGRANMQKKEVTRDAVIKLADENNKLLRINNHMLSENKDYGKDTTNQ